MSFLIAKDGDNCRSVAIEYKATVRDIYRWNFVGDNYSGDCTSFTAGEKYCVKVNNNLRKRNWFYKTQGMTGTKLALAKKKIASAKSKSAAAAAKTTKKAATTTKKATSTTKKATTTTSASSATATQSKPGDDWSSTPANAPSNAVRHIISTCTKYATVTSSDSWCGPFAEKYGITEDQLYAYNAFLHKTCDNLDDGKAYCVGV